MTERPPRPPGKVRTLLEDWREAAGAIQTVVLTVAAVKINSALRVRIVNGRLEASKLGRDWIVPTKAPRTYLDGRTPRGWGPAKSAWCTSGRTGTPAKSPGSVTGQLWRPQLSCESDREDLK